MSALQSSTDYSGNLVCLYIFIKTLPFRHLHLELNPIPNTFFVSCEKALRACEISVNRFFFCREVKEVSTAYVSREDQALK